MSDAILAKKGIYPPLLEVCTAKPAEDYPNLRRQFFSLRTLLNNKNAYIHEFHKKDYDLERQKLQVSSDSLNSEREMNALLTSENLAQTDTIDSLTKQVASLQRLIDAVIKGHKSLDKGRADEMIDSMKVYPSDDIDTIVKSVRTALLQLKPIK